MKGLGWTAECGARNMVVVLNNEQFSGFREMNLFIPVDGFEGFGLPDSYSVGCS